MNQTQTTQNRVQRIKTRDLVLTGMFTAIICVLSQISIPVPPIPFSLGLLAIFLTGALLPPRFAFLSVMAYLLLGAFGVPVFAGFKGGLQNLTGMTGGYLAAYPLMALIIAISCKLIRKHKVFALAIGMTTALLVCYLLGTAWFTVVANKSFYTALTLCVFPFIAFDIIKIALAISFSLILRKTVMKELK
jgi:biotin transport system substrate-specific component